MGLNMNALKGVQEDLNSRGSGGIYFYANKLGAEEDFRMLPPLPHMNGLYFQEQQVWWINKKPYISHKTFNKDCVIEQEIKAAKALKDKDIDKLLADDQLISLKTRFLMPALRLVCEFDAANRPTKISVDGDKAVVLICGPILMKAINKTVTSRNFQNGTEDGLMDREKGFNLLLSKSGKGLDTTYGAEGWREPTEMDAKYYKEIPDVVALTKKEMESDAYLRGVIRNFIYGEAMPNKNETAAPTQEDSAPATTGRSRTAAPAAETKPEAKAEAPAGDAGTGTRRRNTAAPDDTVNAEKNAAPGTRNVMNDLASLANVGDD